MYKLNEQEIFYDVAEGQAIIINSLNGCYYSLNAISSKVFEDIIAGYSKESIEAALLEAAGREIAIGNFIDSLVSENIILVTDDKNDGTLIYGKDIFADGYSLDLAKFDDMQDLLLSDPVHDADPNIGWPKIKEEVE